MSCENERYSPVAALVSSTEVTSGIMVFESSASPVIGLESQVERVVIRDSRQLTVLCNVDDWTMQKFLGALTDEPLDYEGLLSAAAVFGPIPELNVERRLLPTGHALQAVYRLSHEVSSWVWIDLSARMVVQWLPVFHPGLYQCDDVSSGGSEVVYTLLPPDWRLESVSSCPNWADVVAQRLELNSQIAKRSKLTSLWSEVLTRDWVELVWEFRKRIGENIWRSYLDDKSGWLQEQLVRLFLKTPRNDLDDLSPWIVAQESKHFVDQACQYRRELWVHHGKPPRSKVCQQQDTYQACLGTVQIRLLLEVYDYLLAKIQKSPWTTLQSNSEEWFECVKKWMAHFLKGIPEGSVWTRQELIELEQALMPIPTARVEWRSQSQNTMLLPEASALPGFEEIFSFDGTWDYEQPAVMLENTETEKDGDHERGETTIECVTPSKAMDVSCLLQTDGDDTPRSELDIEEFATVWKHSYLNWDADWPMEACYSSLVMKLSFLVSEILMELQRASDQWHSEELTERFKHVQQASEFEERVAFEAAADVFCELLEELTHAHPELVPRLADLQSRLWEQARKLASKRAS